MDDEARNEAIARAVLAGMTGKQAGIEWGLTRERIYQITRTWVADKDERAWMDMMMSKQLHTLPLMREWYKGRPEGA